MRNPIISVKQLFIIIDGTFRLLIINCKWDAILEIILYLFRIVTMFFLCYLYVFVN